MIRTRRFLPGDASAAGVLLLVFASLAFVPRPRVEAAWQGLIRADDPLVAANARIEDAFEGGEIIALIVTGTPPAAAEEAARLAPILGEMDAIASIVAPAPDLGMSVPGTVSADGRHAAVYCEIDRDHPSQTVTRDILDFVAALEPPEGVTVEAAGSLVEAHHVAVALQDDMVRIVPLVFVALVIVGWWLLRTWGAALAFFVTLGVVLLLTIAMIGVLYGSITTITSLVVPIVTTIAAANAVHLAARLRRDRQRLPLAEALRETRHHGGRATLLAAGTTGAGFLALLSIGAPDFSHLAVLGALGCLATWLTVSNLMPALLARWDAPREATTLPFAALVNVARRDLAGRGWISAALVGALLIAGAGVLRLHSATRALDQIPADSSFPRISRILDDQLGGSVAVEAAWTRPAGFRSPEGLAVLGEATAHVRSEVPAARVVTSAFEAVGLVQAALPGLGPVGALAVLESGRVGKVPRVLSSTGDTARITVRFPNDTTRDVIERADAVEAALREVVAPGDTVDVGGTARLISRSVEHVVQAQGRASLLSILLVCLLASVLLRTWRVLPVLLAANVLPLLALAGALGWAGVPMSLSTAVVGSVVFGLIVDDTLHYLYALREEGPTPEAPGRALVRLGPAFAATSAVLLTGTLVTSLGRVPAVTVFSRLMALGVLLALLCDLFLAPRVAARLWRPSRG